MKKRIITALAVAAAGLGAVGCSSDADKVNENLGKECERFECQRRIVGINGITDKVLFQVEGRCSIEGNGKLPKNIEVICKVGPDAYKKHFVGLSDNVTWLSTQLESLDVSEYRTKFIIKPQNIVPDFDLSVSDNP